MVQYIVFFVVLIGFLSLLQEYWDVILFIVVMSVMFGYIFLPKGSAGKAKGNLPHKIQKKQDEPLFSTHNNITVEIEGLEIIFRCKIDDTPLVLRVIEVYTESLQIIYKSKNIDTVISRVSVCRGNCKELESAYGFIEQSKTMLDIVENMARNCYIQLIDVKMSAALVRLEKAKTDKGKYGALLYFTGWLQKYKNNIPEDIVDSMTKKLISQMGIDAEPI